MKSYDQMKNERELYGDSEDIERLDNMPETMRETILYERYKKLHEIEEKKLLQERTQSVQKPSSIQPCITSETVKFQECDFILSRDLIVKNIFKPNIIAIKGCFVRVKLDKIYKIAKIVGFKDIAPYPLHDKQNLKGTLALVLDLGGKSLKTIDLGNVSSRSPREEEFEEFIQKFKIHSAADLKANYKRVMAEMKRDLDNNEITKMIENRLKANPKKKTNTQIKIELILNRDRAINEKNKEMAKHYQKLLENVEDEEREIKKQKHDHEMNEVKKRLENK